LPNLPSPAAGAPPPVRDVARRLGRYASDGRARPGSSGSEQLLWGLAQVARAARLVASDRALLKAALVPTTLTFLGSAALAAALARSERRRYLEAAFASFVAISSMPPTILWRQWQRVGLEARRAVGASPGEEEHPGKSLAWIILHELMKAARQAAAVAAALAPVYAVVEVLPFVGHGLTLVLGALWAWYWVVLDAFEIPVELAPGQLDAGEPTWFERPLHSLGRRFRLLLPLRWAGRFVGWLSRPWRHEARFTERHPWATAGFAIATVAFLAIPVLGVFLRVVAITAATILLVELGNPADGRSLQVREGEKPDPG